MTAAPRPAPSTPRDFEFPGFERDVLRNGMRLVVAPMRRLPVVTAILVIDGGASKEVAGLEGVADIVAHSLGEGTRTRSADDLVMALEKLGTSVGASADWESSILKTTVMSRNLPGALELMAEMATEPRLDEHAVTRIRDERLSEIIQSRSEPSVLADEALASDLFGLSSRYGVPIGGTAQTVGVITPAHVRAHHAAVYKPEAATLILAGDIDGDSARSLADKVFGGWKSDVPGGASRSLVPPYAAGRGVRVVDRSGAQQSELRMGHIGVPRSHPKYFDIVVMNAVFGGLFSSRINLNLREVHGYTYGASSYFDWRREAGPFVIATAVQSESTGPAISEVLKEIARLQQEPIDSSELSLATSYLAGVFPIRYETAEAVASGLANMVIFDLPDDYFTSYRRNILGVSSAQVQQAAQTFLQPERMRIVVAGNPEIVSSQLTPLGFGEISVLPGEA